MELFQVVRQTGDVARCDDVVLRETSATRLVFRADLVNNAQDAGAPIRGWIITQRKKTSGEWEDYNEVKLSDLKASEWTKTELKAAEVDKLVRHLAGLYRLYRQGGLPSGKTHFLKVDLQDDESPESIGNTVDRLLEISRRAGVDAFGRVVDWTLGNTNSAQVVTQLERLDISTVQKLHSLSGLATLKTALEAWERNQDNSSEEFWQKTLRENAFVLSQAFSFPVLVIQDKAYVGGQEVTKSGSGELDFLAANALTANAVLVEIKTPKTPLLGKVYRGKDNAQIYGASVELSGALAQVRNYRYQLTTNYHALRHGREGEFEVFAPRCLVVAGHVGRDLGSEPRRRSFEAIRNGLKDVTLVSYDELFDKIRALCDLLEGTKP